MTLWCWHVQPGVALTRASLGFRHNGEYLDGDGAGLLTPLLKEREYLQRKLTRGATQQ